MSSLRFVKEHKKTELGSKEFGQLKKHALCRLNIRSNDEKVLVMVGVDTRCFMIRNCGQPQDPITGYRSALPKKYCWLTHLSKNGPTGKCRNARYAEAQS